MISILILWITQLHAADKAIDLGASEVRGSVRMPPSQVIETGDRLTGVHRSVVRSAFEREERAVLKRLGAKPEERR